jgi:hypothetical protein
MYLPLFYTSCIHVPWPDLSVVLWFLRSLAALDQMNTALQARSRSKARTCLAA